MSEPLKPRVIKIEYFESFFSMDLEDVSFMVLNNGLFEIKMRTTDGFIIEGADKDKNFEVLKMLYLNAFTTWKNYDIERRQKSEGQMLLYG